MARFQPHPPQKRDPMIAPAVTAAETAGATATPIVSATTAAILRPPLLPQPMAAQRKLNRLATRATQVGPMTDPAAIIVETVAMTGVDLQAVAATVPAGMATATPIAVPR